MLLEDYFLKDVTDLFVIPVVGESLHYKVVDAVECGLLVWGVLDGHGDERDVGVGRLHHVLGGGMLGDAVVRSVGGAHVPDGG